MDNTAVIAPFSGFAVAPEKDAHQLPTSSPSHDLSGFYEPNANPPEKSGTPLAHRRRQRLFQFNDLGGGGVRGNQSALQRRHNSNNNDDGTIIKDESPCWKNGSHTQAVLDYTGLTAEEAGGA